MSICKFFLIFWLGLGGSKRIVNCVSVDLRGFWPDWSGILTNKKSGFCTRSIQQNMHISLVCTAERFQSATSVSFSRSDQLQTPPSRQGLRSTTAGQQSGAKRQVGPGEIWEIWKVRKLGEKTMGVDYMVYITVVMGVVLRLDGWFHGESENPRMMDDGTGYPYI